MQQYFPSFNYYSIKKWYISVYSCLFRSIQVYSCIYTYRSTSCLLKKQARHQCAVCKPSSDCLVVYNQNSFHPWDLSESIEIKSPISDFVPVLHSSPIIDRRHSKKIKNWRTLILNCQSLRGKVEAFQSSVDYFQPDCILGTESWLDKSVSTNEIFPPGYKIFRRDRITSTQGGGGECLSLSKKLWCISPPWYCYRHGTFMGESPLWKIKILNSRILLSTSWLKN